jgi:hypothetical protein
VDPVALKGEWGGFHDLPLRLSFSLPTRQKLFCLLLEDYGQKIGTMAKENHLSAATAWQLAVESWLRRWGLTSIRQNPNLEVSSALQAIWADDQIGPTNCSTSASWTMSSSLAHNWPALRCCPSRADWCWR